MITVLKLSFYCPSTVSHYPRFLQHSPLRAPTEKKAQDHCPETVLLLSINCPASSFFFRLDEGAHHCFNSQDYRSETVLLLPINCPALSFFFRSGKGAHCCFTGATSFFLSFSSFHLSFSHFIRRFPLFICRFPFFICCFPLFICRFLCFTGRFFGPIASIPLLSD